MVFFEAPHRIVETLEDMASVFEPERVAAVARELTKAHESVYRGSLARLLQIAGEEANFARGEITVVLAGKMDAAPTTLSCGARSSCSRQSCRRPALRPSSRNSPAGTNPRSTDSCIARKHKRHDRALPEVDLLHGHTRTARGTRLALPAAGGRSRGSRSCWRRRRGKTRQCRRSIRCRGARCQCHRQAHRRWGGRCGQPQGSRVFRCGSRGARRCGAAFGRDPPRT